MRAKQCAGSTVTRTLLVVKEHRADRDGFDVDVKMAPPPAHLCFATDALGFATAPEALVEFANDNGDDVGEKLRVSGKVPPHPPRKAQNPLADGNVWYDRIAEVRGAVAAAPRCA